MSYIIDALIVCQKSEAADYKYEEQEAVAYYREYLLMCDKEVIEM